jgi:hypothetical protein
MTWTLYHWSRLDRPATELEMLHIFAALDRALLVERDLAERFQRTFHRGKSD